MVESMSRYITLYATRASTSNEHFVNHDFSRELDIAFKVSILRDGHRRYKYGADVAERWKRGSTPEEAREKWRLTAAKHRAEAEDYSDSD